jgi:hypothetical protein
VIEKLYQEIRQRPGDESAVSCRLVYHDSRLTLEFETASGKVFCLSEQEPAVVAGLYRRFGNRQLLDGANTEEVSVAVLVTDILRQSHLVEQFEKLSLSKDVRQSHYAIYELILLLEDIEQTKLNNASH